MSGKQCLLNVLAEVANFLLKSFVFVSMCLETRPKSGRGFWWGAEKKVVVVEWLA